MLRFIMDYLTRFFEVEYIGMCNLKLEGRREFLNPESTTGTYSPSYDTAPFKFVYTPISLFAIAGAYHDMAILVVQ